MKKAWLALVVILPIGHLIYLYAHREFAPSDFRHPFVLQLTGRVSSVEREEVLHILNQPFHYCGAGKQMTAFESADERYVIKFFNPRPLLREKWFHSFKKMAHFNSSRWISNAYFKRKQRLLKLFDRYQMAYDDLRDESGLVYVHLNQSTYLGKTLTLIDQKGAEHTLSIVQYPFVLQKKAKLVNAEFNALMQAGDSERLKERVEQLYALFRSRATKGFTDRIQTLHNNYGFVGDRAIQIDLGRIHKDEEISKDPSEEIERVNSGVKESLKANYPALFYIH